MNLKKQIVSKSFDWCMAHRLGKGYQGKCKSLHGHSYSATVVMQLHDYSTLNDYDMVKDYNDMKSFKTWIDDNLDHGCLVSSTDKSLLNFLKKEKSTYFVIEGNPTAENIAIMLYKQAQKLNDSYAYIIEVRVKESLGTEAICGGML